MYHKLSKRCDRQAWKCLRSYRWAKFLLQYFDAVA